MGTAAERSKVGFGHHCTFPAPDNPEPELGINPSSAIWQVQVSLRSQNESGEGAWGKELLVLMEVFLKYMRLHVFNG